jgi:hypothetical protein
MRDAAATGNGRPPRRPRFPVVSPRAKEAADHPMTISSNSGFGAELSLRKRVEERARKRTRERFRYEPITGSQTSYGFRRRYPCHHADLSVTFGGSYGHLAMDVRLVDCPNHRRRQVHRDWRFQIRAAGEPITTRPCPAGPGSILIKLHQNQDYGSDPQPCDIVLKK